jgi:hypothetical protein
MSERSAEDRSAAIREQRRIAEKEHNIALGRTGALEQAALKQLGNVLSALFLLNGGAAVAVLAFLGGLAGKEKIGQLALALVAKTLIWFTAGVVFATLASVAAYVTNISQANAAWMGERSYSEPFLQETPASNRLYTVAQIWQWVMWVSMWLALAAFVFGVFKVTGAVELIGKAGG